MRLKTMATAVLLVSTAIPLAMLGGPAGAHTSDFPQPEHLDCELHEGITKYNGSLDIEHHYVQAGWWGDQRLGIDTSGSVPDTTEDGTARGAQNDWRCGGDGDQPDGNGNPTADGRDSPVWLHLKSTDSGQNDESFKVHVRSTGGVVPAVDVFEFKGNHPSITPDCPQGLVLPDIYPKVGEGEGAPGYLSRLLHETVDRHQRGRTIADFSATVNVGTVVNTIDITLDPEATERGYIVAIYPQIATTETQAGPPGLTYEVTADGTEMAIDDGVPRPSVPLQATHWVSSPSHIFGCVDEGVPLPSVMGFEAPELPTPSTEDGVNELLDAALGDL